MPASCLLDAEQIQPESALCDHTSGNQHINNSKSNVITQIGNHKVVAYLPHPAKSQPKNSLTIAITFKSRTRCDHIVDQPELFGLFR